MKVFFASLNRREQISQILCQTQSGVDKLKMSADLNKHLMLVLDKHILACCFALTSLWLKSKALWLPHYFFSSPVKYKLNVYFCSVVELHHISSCNIICHSRAQ